MLCLAFPGVAVEPASKTFCNPLDLDDGALSDGNPDLGRLADRIRDQVTIRHLLPGQVPSQWVLPPSSVTHLVLEQEAWSQAS